MEGNREKTESQEELRLSIEYPLHSTTYCTVTEIRICLF
jgi:hypothetical protein